MADPDDNQDGTRVPQGYGAIPVSRQQLVVPLSVCVIVRDKPDPVSGRLIVLRDTVDAKVFLGAMLDSTGRVHQWLELWVQSLEGLTQTLPAYVESLSNEVLDQRWRGQTQAFDQLDQIVSIATGWETTHPSPTFLDGDVMEPVHPTDGESNDPWQLCLDDVLLHDKELPIYSTTLHRYLYVPALGADSPFVPVTAESPTNQSCQPMSRVAGKLLPFNPGGGLMMVRPFGPIGTEAFVDLLTGGSWGGLVHGRTIVDLGISATGFSEDFGEQRLSDGWMFLGAQGRWGRLLETTHLKLRLLADMLAAVRLFVSHTQRPLFNVGPDSFQISLGRSGCALPFLWTSKATLVDPGVAIALPIQTSDCQYYLPGRETGAAIYHPQSLSEHSQGKCDLRVRQVLEATGGSVTLEGTLTTQEAIDPARHDLAWLRLNLADKRVDLYAYLDRESAMAAGEWRFRTIGQRLDKDAIEALHAAEGVPLKDTPYEMIPLLSSPCDLYALGVLAVRTLLVDQQTKLSVALDEILSLARQVATQEQEDDTDLASRIAAAFERDDRWTESLGPHRLTDDEIEPREAFDLVPPRLWWDILAMVVRLFPGIAPDCPARDFGDAPSGGIHKVFDMAMNDLETLLLRTRSLIVIDWRFNREVHAVIRRQMMGLSSA